MYGDYDAGMTRNDVLSKLRTLGVTKVVVHFSGGNDEGGADQITLHKVDGTTEDFLDPGAYQDYTSKKYQVYDGALTPPAYRPATDAEVEQSRLHAALEAPIYDQYGGFGGEFYVSGNLTWDVATGKAHINAQEEVPSYEDREYEV